MSDKERMVAIMRGGGFSNYPELADLLIIKGFGSVEHWRERCETAKHNEILLDKAEEKIKTIGKETAEEIIRELLKNTHPTFDKDGKPIIELNADFSLNMCKKYKVEVKSDG